MAQRAYEMKRVTPGRARIIHVETPLGIINIHVGLRDTEGRRVERISVIPNASCPGEPVVTWDGTRLIEELPR